MLAMHRANTTMNKERKKSHRPSMNMALFNHLTHRKYWRDPSMHNFTWTQRIEQCKNCKQNVYSSLQVFFFLPGFALCVYRSNKCIWFACEPRKRALVLVRFAVCQRRRPSSRFSVWCCGVFVSIRFSRVVYSRFHRCICKRCYI